MAVNRWDVIYSEWFRYVWSCLLGRRYRLDGISKSLPDMSFANHLTCENCSKLLMLCLWLYSSKTWNVSFVLLVSSCQLPKRKQWFLLVLLHNLRLSSPLDRFIVQFCVAYLISLLCNLFILNLQSFLALPLLSEQKLWCFLLCSVSRLIFFPCLKYIYCRTWEYLLSVLLRVPFDTSRYESTNRGFAYLEINILNGSLFVCDSKSIESLI